MSKILLPQRGILHDRLHEDWVVSLILRGDAAAARAVVVRISSIVNNQRAMAAVAASETAMAAVIDSETAMAAVIDSETAMAAVAASQTAMDAIFASTTTRTLIFTTPYINTLWGSSVAIQRFAAYLSTLSVSQGSSKYLAKITVPIDGSLVSAVSSLWGISTDTGVYYDNRAVRARPSGNVIMDAMDVTVWTEYSGTIASGDTGLEFDVEVYYSTYGTLVINTSTNVPSGKTGYSIQMSYNGTINPHRFYGLKFTRRT
jgi:hypothetical protein